MIAAALFPILFILSITVFNGDHYDAEDYYR